MAISAKSNGVDGLRIDVERLRADLHRINEIGRIEGIPGYNRISFSDTDMAGRRWLMERMEEAGLAARMDTVGNVFGRWEAGEGPAVLAGSHTDTVPMGGPFDGTLGVLAALEAVRAMRDQGIRPARPVEVLSTADEEGRFGGMLGSQAICGEIDADWIAAAVDETGEHLTNAMAAQGLVNQIPDQQDLSGILVFLELHIEQGPVLEQSGDEIGIAVAVSGVFNWTVTLIGEANHSGTTPMALRRDAFRGLAEFGAGIPAILDTAGTNETRLTVGRVALSPNFPHSVAGEAVFSIIGRDPDEAVMEAVAAACRDRIDRVAVGHGLCSEIVQQSWLPPTRLDGRVADRLHGIATRSGFRTCRMTSGAGHDAQTFARHVPAGLVFVPSQQGISHAPEEWTDWQDVVRGATLLARAVASFATA